MMMTPAKTLLRSAATLVTAGALLGMLSACSPSEPAPTPTKTALFASEEEAFAAAEETYRAYLADLNATDLHDDDTFEAVYAWLTGTALTSERESLTYYHAENLVRTGETSFHSYEPVSNSPKQIVANLCLDVSQVDLLDSAGDSVLPTDRADQRALKVTFVPGKTSTGLRIASNHEPDSFRC